MDDDDDNKFSGRFTPWSFGSWPRVYRDLFKYGNARPAVLRSLDLKGDERILDAGSGSGFYSIYLAKHLDSGKIVAVDQSKEMLAFLDRKARRKKLNNSKCLFFRHTAERDHTAERENKNPTIISSNQWYKY